MQHWRVKRLPTLLLAVLLAAALLGGCRPAFPTGKFAHSAADASRYLIFYPDGRWEGFLDGNLLTFGAYTTDGDRVTFETDHQCQEAGAPEPVTYTWAFTAETLTFAPNGEDACAARKDLLAGEFRRSQKVICGKSARWR